MSNGILSSNSARISFKRDQAKAAPAISASNDFAIGEMEAASHLNAKASPTGLSSGVETPRASSHRPDTMPVDAGYPFTSTYEGHDAKVIELLERTYFESAPFGLNHLGPIVRRAGPQARGGQVRSKQSARNSDHPVNLIAQLNANHASPILGLLLSPDQSYLLSVDTDGRICIWDPARFERNVTSKPRLTLKLSEGTVTAVCAIKNRSAFAFVLSGGSIVLVRVSGASASSLKHARIEIVQRLSLIHI